MTDTVRIDKWLWAARFFKTRSLASAALDSGKVRLGTGRGVEHSGEHLKPSRILKVGEILMIDNGATEWEVTVLGLSDVRGSAPVAQALYAETVQSIVRRQNDAEQNKLYREPALAFKGRPTKRDRRLLDKSQP
jgi:ribosome-associated heat shock protein Hsp15